MRSVSFQTRSQNSKFKRTPENDILQPGYHSSDFAHVTRPSDPKGDRDPEIYVGDDAVIERLNEIIYNIQNDLYDEETKQSIYYYGEYYVANESSTEPSEYIQQVNEAAKFYITGWWIHSLIETQDTTEEKLIPEESVTDKKQ